MVHPDRDQYDQDGIADFAVSQINRAYYILVVKRGEALADSESSHDVTPDNRRFGLCYRAAVLPPDEISIALFALKVNISK